MNSNNPNRKSAQKQARLLQSVNLLISGNNNVTRVEYRQPSQKPPTLEELIALRNVLQAQTNVVEAQNQLIKIYQNRTE